VAYPKVVPIDRKQRTKARLVAAVGKVLAREGFRGLGVNKVAAEAGVDKKLIYRYFGGLPALIKAYSETVDFWPTVDELLGRDPGALKKLAPDRQLAEFFKSYLRALRKRPYTQDILAWEMLERNELTKALEGVRVRTALEYFEHLHGDIPDEADLSAIVAVMAAAVNQLIVRSRISNYFGGIDFREEKGWERIDRALDLLLRGVLDKDEE